MDASSCEHADRDEVPGFTEGLFAEGASSLKTSFQHALLAHISWVIGSKSLRSMQRITLREPDYGDISGV